MRWRIAHLYGTRQTGRDALGNPITERVDMGECTVRSVPWASTDTENAGNGYSDVSGTVVTPMPLSAVLGATQAVIDGSTYSVDGMADLGRMRTLVLVREKGRRWADSE